MSATNPEPVMREPSLLMEYFLAVLSPLLAGQITGLAAVSVSLTLR